MNQRGSYRIALYARRNGRIGIVYLAGDRPVKVNRLIRMRRYTARLARGPYSSTYRIDTASPCYPGAPLGRDSMGDHSHMKRRMK